MQNIKCIVKATELVQIHGSTTVVLKWYLVVQVLTLFLAQVGRSVSLKQKLLEAFADRGLSPALEIRSSGGALKAQKKRYKYKQ